jgi:hypothetical protein
MRKDDSDCKKVAKNAYQAAGHQIKAEGNGGNASCLRPKILTIRWVFPIEQLFS